MVIELSTLGLFALSAAVLTLIPGADLLCALSNAVSQGTKAGLITVLGAVTGVICHVCAFKSSYGVTPRGYRDRCL